MASTRYGRIYHSDFNYINIKFSSADKRQSFVDGFEEYHASHEHDGEVPRFENISASEAIKEAVHDYEDGKMTIDGYLPHQIEDFHEDKHGGRWVKYEPPTCCVAPLISFNRKVRGADTLRRHELSAIFGNMPADDFKSLLESVAREGFMDNVIRIHENKVLDGWHRYRAAKELNLLRKLVFRQWNEKDEGDPAAFVLGRNIERRHLTAGQRAQIVVSFNERFGHGGDRSKSSNGGLKTREDLAKKAGVGTSTIDRAAQVEKEGKSEVVISGEQTAGEVLKARETEQKLKRKNRKLKAIWDARIQAARDWLGEGDMDLNQYLGLDQLEDGFARYHEPLADAFKSGIKRYELARGDFAGFQESAEDVSLEDVEKECKAISVYAHDIANHQDADWIQEMIQSKKQADELTEARGEAEEAYDRMCEFFNESDLPNKIGLEAFERAACVAHPNWGVETLPDVQDTDIPDIWKGRFNLLISEIRIHSTWIQELISDETEGESESSEDLKTLRKQVKAEMPLWKKRDKEQCQNESDHIGKASFSMLIAALRDSINYVADEETGEIPEGEATAAELKELLRLMTSNNFSLILVVRRKLREASETKQPAPAPDNEPEEDTVESLWEKITPAISVWKSKRKDKGVGRASKTMFLSATKCFHGLPWDAETDVDLLQKLLAFVTELHGTGYTFERYVKMQVDGASIWEESEETPVETAEDCQHDDTDEDTSLAEIDNLPAVKHFLEILCKQVGTIEHSIDRDNVSVAIFDTLVEAVEGLTEREQLSALIDCAHTIASESIKIG